ncbi:IclR family transcriptional regulator [Mesobacterium pallidum]|uniref:IclR family transcriptional regulator n=1 Tax=Mesobacterium pallidum TaxID=2872037 RepID=UPI001EE338FE|nr:IclR family transcriptional regulator [Mesobacterium pallidum]
MAKDPKDASAGIQSLDAALRVLSVMAAHDGPISLTDLARSADMPPSKVHRYLASFLAAGLVEQGGRSGKYDLGRGAVELGLSAIARHDFVNRPSNHLPELREATGLTVLLSVWGAAGPTVVRWERAAAPVVTSMGLGTTLPLLNSSTGRVFLAYGPRPPMEKLLASELARARKSPEIFADFDVSRAGVAALCDRVRAEGYATVSGDYIPGLVAVAAPVLDWQGEAQAVITLIGTGRDIARPGSAAVGQLLEFCRAQSFAPLGAR